MAVAWAGAVPPLVALLRHDAFAVRLAAVGALKALAAGNKARIGLDMEGLGVL